MTSLRNLPLAAFRGVDAMNGLRAETGELATGHLKVAEPWSGLNSRAEDNVSLDAQHLYVRGGELAEQVSDLHGADPRV